MGVTIRERRDKQIGVWWVFVSHMNRRTSLKVGSYRVARRVQDELRIMLALDRVVHNLRPRMATTRRKLLRQGDDLRLRLSRLLGELEQLLERNRKDRR